MARLDWRSDFFLVRNERGYESLCCDGFVFGRYKGNVMRCSNRRCKGKVLVDDVNNISRWSYITQHSLLHTKESFDRYLNWRSRAEYVKQRDSRYIPRKLRIRETQNLDCFVSHCAASRFVDRNTPKPQNPRSIHDIDLSDPSLKYLLDKSDNNNALIFGNRSFVKNMAHADVLFMDGTFSSCCKLYAQLYIIHMKDGEVCRPALFCFLPNRKRMTHEWLFNRVELLVKKQHDADVTVFDRDVVVKIDFEKAVVGALSSKRCCVSGCFFTLRKVYTRMWGKVLARV